MTSPRKKILLIVLGIHFCSLLYVTISFESPPPKKTPLTIHTFTPSPPKPVEKVKTKPASTPKSPPKKSPPVKKVAPSPAIKKAPAKKTKKTKKAPPLKKAKPSKEVTKMQRELEEIQKTIAKIEAENDKIAPKSSLRDPPKIVFEDKGHGQESERAAYVSSLISYLQAHLLLPDVGEVKLQLTIKADGSVGNLKVLFAKSVKNRKRLEEEIPRLFLPPLPKGQKRAEAETFILTFDNQE